MNDPSTLTEAYRLTQATVSAQTVNALLTVWELLDPAALDATLAGWLTAAVPVVEAHHQQSARLAVGYYKAIRDMSGARGTYAPIILDPDLRAITTSLTVTGPASIKSATAKGIRLVDAVDTAKGRSLAAASRQALAGGRSTVGHSISHDSACLGWARVTSGRCCAFCAMLASRGPVYGDGRKAGSNKQWHDACHCITQPVYQADAPWPPDSERFRAMWDDATSGQSGADAINAFRRTFNK